ncbi:hypothetical protein C7974DRAFT_418206 [Boeremia exigua]|uniref:uncharacterized protein n=1 Tax=Boeremia exigua TaxID=749465 RepID=UPI001E8ED94E|nr:uncharacterized protein C7974DRAFT_418206 [Boeremia exigua]KAH6613118.1 hypothetical protein C7974DRAFT_418206 [Boeremia exigua]
MSSPMYNGLALSAQAYVSDEDDLIINFPRKLKLRNKENEPLGSEALRRHDEKTMERKKEAEDKDQEEHSKTVPLARAGYNMVTIDLLQELIDSATQTYFDAMTNNSSRITEHHVATSLYVIRRPSVHDAHRWIHLGEEREGVRNATIENAVPVYLVLGKQPVSRPFHGTQIDKNNHAGNDRDSGYEENDSDDREESDVDRGCEDVKIKVLKEDRQEHE